MWSVLALTQGAVGLLTGGAVVVALFGLRLLVGMAEAPAFPGNSRIVAAWFPTGERGTAAAVFNSAQYFATVAFAPLLRGSRILLVGNSSISSWGPCMVR
jgi:ACS family glucarate transporter-like MFS transporter